MSSSSELFFCFLHCLYFHHVPFLCEFVLPSIYHVETFNLAVHSLYMKEELKTYAWKWHNMWTSVKGGGELTFPSREPPNGLFSGTIQFYFFVFFSLEKNLSISSLLGLWLPGIGRGLRISLFSTQT